MDPRAGPLNNSRAARGWVRMLMLEWLRWICTGCVKVNYSSRGPWHLRPSRKRCCREMCSWSRCGLAHPLNGIAIKMTQVNEVLMKWGKAQQGQNQQWLYQATAQHHTAALLPWRTAGTDGAQSLKELNACFRGMAHRLREWYLCVYIKRLERMYWKVHAQACTQPICFFPVFTWLLQDKAEPISGGAWRADLVERQRMSGIAYSVGMRYWAPGLGQKRGMLKKSWWDHSQCGCPFTPPKKHRRLLHVQALCVLKMPKGGMGEWEEIEYTAFSMLNSFCRQIPIKQDQITKLLIGRNFMSLPFSCN